MTARQDLGQQLIDFTKRRKIPAQSAVINAAATLIHNVVPNATNMGKARAALVEAGCDRGILTQIDELTANFNNPSAANR